MELNEEQILSLSVENKFAREIAMPLWWQGYWSKPSGEKEYRVQNGSTFFLNTGKRIFGVTAAHNLIGKNSLSDAMETALHLDCNVGTAALNPYERLIDIDKDIDIATFDITSDEIKLAGGLVFDSHQSSWPPKPPEQEKGVIFAGFPGAERLYEGKDGIVFPALASGGIANSVSESRILTVWDREQWVKMSDWRMPPEDFNVGGISGGPLLLPIDVKGFRSWRLGGVIIEGRSGTEYGTELIWARRADYINADGTLNKLRVL